jgi:hypothetical protein
MYPPSRVTGPGDERGTRVTSCPIPPALNLLAVVGRVTITGSSKAGVVCTLLPLFFRAATARHIHSSIPVHDHIDARCRRRVGCPERGCLVTGR